MTWQSVEYREVEHPKIAPQRYFVSEDGKVLSVSKKRGTHLMTNCRHRDKYYQVCMTQSNGKNTLSLKVHRLVATAWLSNPDSLGYVNHKDEDKTNNHASNLEWCTMLHNNYHSKSAEYKALRGRGVADRARFVEEDVRDIRLLLSKGFTLSQLARVYRTTPSTIFNIKNGNSWSWLV